MPKAVMVNPSDKPTRRATLKDTTMTRQFIAALLSLFLGLTAMTTAPARADEDVVKIIAGLAVLGILANAAKDNTREVVTQRAPKPRHPQPVRKQKVQKARKVAPSRCLQQQWTHSGSREVYGAGCMQKNTRHALPRNCQRRIETRRGVQSFYMPNCLRNNGWRA